MARILVVNPNTSEEATERIALVAGPSARWSTVDVVNVDYGPRYIEGEVDEIVAAHAVAETVARTASAYDAFVVACFSDPGLRAAREVARKPVVGIAEAAFLVARGLGAAFSLLSNAPEDEPIFRRLARSYGHGDLLLSVRSTGTSVGEFARQDPKAYPSLLAAGRLAVADGAGAVGLACAGMCGYAAPLAEELGIPVLDGVACGVALAELYLQLGVTPPWAPVFAPGRRRDYKGGFGSDLEKLYNGDFWGRSRRGRLRHYPLDPLDLAWATLDLA
ncbi:MAG: aspartate/glutamate racemase family protein [Firmicutes bacterium]|nr:aspartate/glutamate racemase family protein [Bacillota bacterium]